ncbi:MAG: TRAP transporter substrate-binding protein DctP [Candidatus Rokubacteria bacterium]|nr:TRAP transporter substrate-binding protein DctP [Candidatus Rokubacteria bacterium]
MERRRFLAKAGAVTAAGAAAILDAPNVIAQPRYRWRMATSWPPKFHPPGIAAEMLAKLAEQMSGGRLHIDVYGAGELVPAFENFEACRQGTIQVGHSAAYYWAGKEPATQWFTAVPFGLNTQGTQAWLVSGGGQKLYDELYSGFGLVPRRGGPTGVQMGGWFRKKIETTADFKGLKMRIPGLGGKVVAKAGGTVTLLPVGDIFPSLERGVIDATEWVGPLQDERAGFHKAAKLYYYPGWHEPGTAGEFFFNKKAYDSLPVDIQRVLDAAAQVADVWSLAEHEAGNAGALERILKHGVQLIRFPDGVLRDFRKLSEDVLREEADKSQFAKKVHEHYEKFKKQWLEYSNLSERAYYHMMFA